MARQAHKKVLPKNVYLKGKAAKEAIRVVESPISPPASTISSVASTPEPETPTQTSYPTVDPSHATESLITKAIPPPIFTMSGLTTPPVTPPQGTSFNEPVDFCFGAAMAPRMVLQPKSVFKKVENLGLRFADIPEVKEQELRKAELEVEVQHLGEDILEVKDVMACLVKDVMGYKAVVKGIRGELEVKFMELVGVQVEAEKLRLLREKEGVQLVTGQLAEMKVEMDKLRAEMVKKEVEKAVDEEVLRATLVPLPRRSFRELPGVRRLGRQGGGGGGFCSVM